MKNETKNYTIIIVDNHIDNCMELLHGYIQSSDNLVDRHIATQCLNKLLEGRDELHKLLTEEPK